MKVHRIIRLLVNGLAIATRAASGASARRVPRHPSPELRRGPWPSNPSARRVVQSVDEGFDWRSAAIGTGGAGALILPASVGGSTYRHRHEHLGVARQPATGSRA